MCLKSQIKIIMMDFDEKWSFLVCMCVFVFGRMAFKWDH